MLNILHLFSDWLSKFKMLNILFFISSILNHRTLYFATMSAWSDWDRAIGHIINRHCCVLPNRSTFYHHISVSSVVRTCLKDYHRSFPHKMESGRRCFFNQFDQFIGQDQEKKKCRWLAVLKEGEILLTAFPVMTPATLQ